jgi:HD superfamily phosphohydrolase
VILRDPVHGLIAFEEPLDQIVVRLLATPEVQRLRRIRALGPASLAYPGAEHTRFAHAVGSAHVMKRYLRRVSALASELPPGDRVDPDSARAALAAALLHDLGHGPYSHTFEVLLPGAPKHERWTSALLLDPSTKVHAVLAEVDPQLPRAVERLVHGEHPIQHLSRAVSGTFDVDRCDYLMRDSVMTGVRYGLLDLEWLLRSLRLYVPQGKRTARLGVDGEKGLTAVEGFFTGRLYMYRQVYLHKAVRAAEVGLRLLFRRLRELDPLPETPPTLERALRGEPLTVGEYLALDDHVLHAGLAGWASSAADPIVRELAESFRERRLYKTIALRAEASSEDAAARLREVARRHGHDPVYGGVIDRVEVAGYAEDDELVVLHDGRAQELLAASPLLHGLARERFVLHRAIVPPGLRVAAAAALDDLT